MTSSLTRVFISHAGSDWRMARRLADDLRALGNHITVDLDDLSIGDDVVQFMNEGITDADFILILYSRYTSDAINQTAELNAAIWNEINQAGAVCLVVRLDDEPLPPLLGPKLFGQIEVGNEDSYARELEKIVKKVDGAEHPTSTVNKAFAADGGNPFRRTRAEYFEDDRDLLARTFAPPDQSRLSKLEDVAPCILEGPRGTGKSMLLMSLRARNYLPVHSDRDGPRIFGCYLKLTRGALTNVSDLIEHKVAAEAMLKETSSQELFICILEAMLSEVRYCTDNAILNCTDNDQQALCRDLTSLFGICFSSPRLDDVLAALGSLRRQIANYLRRRFIYDQAIDVPSVAFDADLIGETVAAIKRRIQRLEDHGFVILLDEYENLYPFQQEFVNGLAKEAAPRFSLKIARKRSGNYPSSTPSGQEWQETHDYSTIDLVYNLADPHQRSAYLSLLGRFVQNVVGEELGETVTLQGLLPEFDTPEVAEARQLESIAALCKVSRAEFDKWPVQRRKEKTTYYRRTAIYRCLRGGQQKRFAGSGELALVSSGVIRYFQEILAVSYYLRAGSGTRDDSTLAMSPEVQNQAVHLVSAHNLTSLSRNVEGKGEALRFFLLDLGACLRHKLLKHNSEPEAARIAVRDPERLHEDAMSNLRGLLDAGVREGVFETREGMPGYRPRHADEAQAVEYMICRMFAPVLGISPRARWRTETTCAELLQLTDRGGRLQAVRTIKSRWVRGEDDDQETLILDAALTTDNGGRSETEISG